MWRRAGAAGRTLVHVDAHHDMAWLDHAGQLTIGNYVCQATKDGIVSEIIWIVPDASWTTSRGREVLRRHLRTLARDYSAKRAVVEAAPRRLAIRLRDVLVTVCALDSLETLDRPVLLDIDIDFLMLPTAEYSRDDRPLSSPWMWPAELAAALRQRIPLPEIVTIARSVAGGYVPLKWKYLGDELACEWEGPARDAPLAREGFRALRAATVAMHNGATSAALTELARAARGLPHIAAPAVHMALLHLSAGDIGQAQQWYRHAAAVDPACRGPHACRGFVALSEGRPIEATAEFNTLITLDPDNAFACLGLARVAVLERNWAEAEETLRSVIVGAPRLLDAHRYLGGVLTRLGRDAEAAATYSRSLRLALEGEVSIEEAVESGSAGSARRDGRHGHVHAALAQIDARAGRTNRAIAGYRMACAAGADWATVHFQVGWLCVKQGHWSAALREWAGAIRRAPRGLQRGIAQAIRSFERRDVRRADRAGNAEVGTKSR